MGPGRGLGQGRRPRVLDGASRARATVRVPTLARLVSGWRAIRILRRRDPGIRIHWTGAGGFKYGAG
jgi:hypothetical protein